MPSMSSQALVASVNSVNSVKKRSAERIDIKTYVDLDLGDLSMHVEFKFEIFHEL